MTRILAAFTPSRPKMVVLFLGLLMFTAAAAYILLASDPGALGTLRYALWAVLVLCPVYAADTGARLLRRTPTLTATDEGLVFRTVFGFSRPIPWAEIGEFRPVIMGKKPWLAIFLEDPRATFARMDMGSRILLAKSHTAGVPNIALRSIQLGARVDDAAEALEKLRKRQQPGK